MLWCCVTFTLVGSIYKYNWFLQYFKLLLAVFCGFLRTHYINNHVVHEKGFYFFLSICLIALFFLNCDSLSNISSTNLHRNGKSRCSWFVSNLKESIQIFIIKQVICHCRWFFKRLNQGGVYYYCLNIRLKICF